MKVFTASFVGVVAVKSAGFGVGNTGAAGAGEAGALCADAAGSCADVAGASCWATAVTQDKDRATSTAVPARRADERTKRNLLKQRDEPAF